MLRALLALAIVGLCSLIPAKAALASTKTIAVYVDGPDARRVREAVLKAVGTQIDVADDKAFRAELVHAGQKGPFGKELDPKTIVRIQEAGRAIGAEAVLVARVRQDAKSRFVLLIVVDVSDGPDPVTKAQLALKSHEKDSDDIASALGDRLDKYAPPPEPLAAVPVHDEPPASTPTETKPPLERRPAEAATRFGLQTTPAQLVARSLFDIAVGADFYGRRFEYRNGISRTPSIQKKLQVLAAGVSGRLFPFAAAGGPLGDIGIAADYSSALFRTTPSFYSFALCARIRPRADARALLVASVGYAVTSFPSTGPATTELPPVTYGSLRPALDGRVTFGGFSILAATAFRAILDENAISTRFYNPRGYGFDAEFGGALMFARRFEWRLVANYERYVFAFTPPSGALFAAGDALDQLYGIRGSLAFVF